MKFARAIQAPFLAFTTLVIAVQFALAAAGAFGASSYKAHEGTGNVIIILVLLSMFIALFTRKFRIVLAVAVVLSIVQGGLGAGGFDHHWMGVLHGLNAFAIAALIGTTTGQAMSSRNA